MSRDPMLVLDGMRMASRLVDAVQGAENPETIIGDLTFADLQLVTIALAEQLVASRPSGDQPKVRTVREIGRIVGVVSHLTGVSVPEVYGRSRRRDVVAARQLAFYVAYGLNITVREIGLALDRDHGTVSSGVARVRRDPHLSELATTTLTYLSRSTP